MNRTPKAIPLKTFLTRLIWLCILPLLLLAAWLAYESIGDDQAQRDMAARNLAHNFAATVDQGLDARIRALNMLALSPLLDDPTRWGGLYREAQGFQENFHSHVILAEVAPPMQMLFNTRVPFGSPLPPLPRPKGHAAAPLALATGKPAVGDSFLGPVANKTLVAIAVPVLRQGSVSHLLLTTLEASQFQKRLDEFALPPGWAITLQDGRGDTIARRAPAGFDATRDVDLDGRFQISSRVSAWTVVLEIPRRVQQATLFQTVLALSLGLLAATLTGVLGGLAASRRLARAVTALSGEPVDAGPIPEIAEISAARHRLDAAAAGLRVSEERFRRLFNDAPLPMAQIGPDGSILAQNARIQQVFGYTPADLPGVDDWWRLAYPDPGYRARALQAWSAAVARASAQGGDIAPGEYRIHCKEGEERIVQISGSLNQDGILVTFLDVTDRRVAEERLQLWANSFEQAELGLVLSDARSNTILSVNPAFARERGYQREEMVGMSIIDIFPPDRLADVRHLMDALNTATHGVFESEHRCKDGRNFPVLLDITVLRDDQGRPKNRIAYALDLTEHKRAERELRDLQASALDRQQRGRLAALNQMQDANTAREKAEAALAALSESEQRLQLFIEHAPASLAMFDRDMRYLAVSQRWLDDYALGDRNIIGLSHYEVFPEIPERWKLIHQRGLAGEVIRCDEDHFRRQDGSDNWLRWEIRPWNTARGSIGGIVVFSEDITRLTLANREIIRLNAGLELRVSERTAELASANRELESFAYAVSHDLRAPLRAMSGFSLALMEDYGHQLTGDAKAYLDQISLASRKMGELIDGLLTLSRSTRGELQRAPVDLSAMARRLLAQFAREEPSRRVNIDIAENLIARGDARMLEAVLTNLLGNAWKYSARVSEARLRVYAEDRAGRRWFCVADNGAGFDIAHAQRLFQPFQRLHRQEEFPGIGIGLATVQRIVHRHGGEIEARGEPGKGAVFCFTLSGVANGDGD